MLAGPPAMGKVSIGRQWLIVAAGVVLCAVFALFAACLIGWLLFRRLWRHPEAPSGSRYVAG